MKNLKELNREELNNINGGSFAYDLGWAIRWFAGLQTPGALGASAAEATYFP